MTTYMLRGQGQIRAGGGATLLDDTDWHNVLSFTTTVNSSDYGYGQQMRQIYGSTFPWTGIPDSDLTHPELTIPAGAHLVMNCSLGYNNTDAGAADGIRDPIFFARVRLVTGRSPTYTAITGYEELIPDSNLTVYCNMPQASVANLSLPPKTVVPIVNQTPNADGNYLQAMSRRFVVRVPEDIVIAANAGFSIQMKTNIENRGFEYDVLAAVTTP